MTQSPLALHDRAVGAAYPVNLPVFEGPLDLLLQLIEKEELDINEVSLVAVTDQYLSTIDRLEEIEPGALADFLVIASKLLFLKSVSLLPKPQPVLEDEEEDVGDALIRQLLEYRRFKQAAQLLQERQDAGLRAYVRTAPKPELERRLDMGNVDLNKLHQALRRVLNRIPSDPPMPRVKTYPITVAEQIDNVRTFLRSTHDRRRSTNGTATAPVRFVELLSRETSRMEVVVTFLAVLELIKQREVRAEQDDTFGEIVLVLNDEVVNADEEI
ncbi:MAG TPA: segregation/condensation protein A [Caldilineaceae bacterium]|nr:segregation/condensation protein A [Caldilineaceae bacterium]